MLRGDGETPIITEFVEFSQAASSIYVAMFMMTSQILKIMDFLKTKI